MTNFVSRVLSDGGKIRALLIPPHLTNGTALFNPSVYVDGDRIFVNVRHCQYTLYYSEKKKYEHHFGPLVYLHPENDQSLTTTNFFGELNPDNLSFDYIHRVDTSGLDQPPKWEFVGLEDGRVVKWDNKFYLCGVRRDTTENGQGRMELSEIKFNSKGVKEVSRSRIEPPNDPNSYCEKNWMPVIDMPFHFIKWTNPTELVKVDPNSQTSTTVFLGNSIIPVNRDLRGGSHVIPWEDGHIGITHEVDLFQSKAGRKDGIYKHRFVVWDKNWKIIKTSDDFSFMGADIEFVCGIAEYNGEYLITFGFQDNAAYILRTTKKSIEDMLK